ncbi:hypothetical protein HAX54_028665 [Datura stramonium]|uniref:Uncharacterized protein n=1 Tax=Datura stramonium TaxID=4076 RepID=A0ABS8V6P4_DATST|nr:hypothetical protein [Datura stramonium]
MHESQLVQLAKAIPSMIPLAIKKALQPGKDKLTRLCSTVQVLESEVNTLRKEVAALSAPPSTGHPTPHEPAKLAKSLPALISQTVKKKMKSMCETLTKLCSGVDVVEGVVISLYTKLRERKSQTSMEVPYMSSLDAAMVAPSTVRGPIDDLFEGLGDEAEHLGNEF